MRPGERNESSTYHCVRKIAMTGGKTARMNSPARVTGTKDGTGVQACTKAHYCISKLTLKYVLHN